MPGQWFAGDLQPLPTLYFLSLFSQLSPTASCLFSTRNVGAISTFSPPIQCSAYCILFPFSPPQVT